MADQHGDILKDDLGALRELKLLAASDTSAGDAICIFDALDECTYYSDSERPIKILEKFYLKYRDRDRNQSQVNLKKGS